jgi:hypothetical protein
MSIQSQSELFNPTTDVLSGATPALRCTTLGTPYIIQSLDQWQEHLTKMHNVTDLNKVKRGLSIGNEGFGSFHPFEYKTEEWNQAWKLLFDRAKLLHCWYDKTSKVFREKL